MNAILICKDCGDQFESPHPGGKSAELQKISSNHNGIPIYLTTCMGICPLEKISVLIAEKDKINIFKTKSLTPAEIGQLIITSVEK
jgi:hypothetical protein